MSICIGIGNDTRFAGKTVNHPKSGQEFMKTSSVNAGIFMT